MTSRNITTCCKNAVGTVFLLAGAFFVCSTLVSMRAVFADPIAPATPAVAGANTASPRGNVASPRATASGRRAVASQNVVASRTATNNAATRTDAPSGRGVATRATRTTTRSTAASQIAATRNNMSAPTRTRGVVSRGDNGVTTRADAAASTRTVRARTATTSAASGARVSLQGTAIRGSKASQSNTYTYLSSKLYTGNYSNIIDSSTGLISADAYNNCLESYYTCMDEICTARNSAQRRCACAGRVKAFAEAETALESANEELIKVSGELALLVATKGKDVSDAFLLTDAEKVMNCVSWQETTNKYGTSSDEAIKWCSSHGIYENGKEVSSCAAPKYCEESGNNFGFDISNIDGSASDILASLQSWADAKEQTLTILTEDNDSLSDAFSNLSNTISGLAGIDGALSNSDNLKDSLAETWGYELFEYAHNNVCNRVLDSCFNGIYEACGTPPSSGRKCSNGSSQCPYNYNSTITVTNTGTYELNFVEPSTGYTTSNSATCFGYTSTSGDPYSSLRGPVADARRSILQKYALDANADCDAYGEQLRTTAQNIGYQKIAAQQALQQKRMEFAAEERETVLSNATAAGSNFDECISEIYDCYETQQSSNKSWSPSRIKTYCAQIANVPHCYETMICNPSSSQFTAIIDKGDSATCLNSTDYTKNTCRNIVTLNEILNGAAPSALGQPCPNISDPTVTTGNCNSAANREQCLLDAGVEGVRTWFDNHQNE